MALVTGASRGAGRGIALELGAAGCHGLRERPGVGGRSDNRRCAGYDRELGSGSDEPRRLRHQPFAATIPSTPDVESLFARIRDDQGLLDLLVNNVWGGYEHSDCRPLPMVPFFFQFCIDWFSCSPPASVRTSPRAVWRFRLMLPQRRGPSS